MTVVLFLWSCVVWVIQKIITPIFYPFEAWRWLDVCRLYDDRHSLVYAFSAGLGWWGLLTIWFCGAFEAELRLICILQAVVTYCSGYALLINFRERTQRIYARMIEQTTEARNTAQ